MPNKQERQILKDYLEGIGKKMPVDCQGAKTIRREARRDGISFPIAIFKIIEDLCSENNKKISPKKEDREKAKKEAKK